MTTRDSANVHPQRAVRAAVFAAALAVAACFGAAISFTHTPVQASEAAP